MFMFLSYLLVLVIGVVAGGFIFRNNPKYLAKLEADFRAKWEQELKDHPAIAEYQDQLKIVSFKLEALPRTLMTNMEDFMSSKIVEIIEQKFGKK